MRSDPRRVPQRAMHRLPLCSAVENLFLTRLYRCCAGCRRNSALNRPGHQEHRTVCNMSYMSDTARRAGRGSSGRQAHPPPTVRDLPYTAWFISATIFGPHVDVVVKGGPGRMSGKGSLGAGGELFTANRPGRIRPQDNALIEGGLRYSDRVSAGEDGAWCEHVKKALESISTEKSSVWASCPRVCEPGFLVSVGAMSYNEKGRMV